MQYSTQFHCEVNEGGGGREVHVHVRTPGRQSLRLQCRTGPDSSGWDIVAVYETPAQHLCVCVCVFVWFIHVYTYTCMYIYTYIYT